MKNKLHTFVAFAIVALLIGGTLLATHVQAADTPGSKIISTYTYNGHKVQVWSVCGNMTIDGSHYGAKDGQCVINTGHTCPLPPPPPKPKPKPPITTTVVPKICLAGEQLVFGACVQLCADGTIKNAFNPTCSALPPVCPNPSLVYPAGFTGPLPSNGVRASGVYAACTVGAGLAITPTGVAGPTCANDGQACSTGLCPGELDGTYICDASGASICQGTPGYTCGAASISLFKASPTDVNLHQTCKLTWNTENAEVCNITDNVSGASVIDPVLLPSGSASSSPIFATTRYTMRCLSKAGIPVVATAQCRLNPYSNQF